MAVGEGQIDSTRCSEPEQSVPNLAKPVDWQKSPDAGEDVHRLHTPLSRLLKQELLKGLVTGSPQEEVGVRTANEKKTSRNPLIHMGQTIRELLEACRTLASRRKKAETSPATIKLSSNGMTHPEPHTRPNNLCKT